MSTKALVLLVVAAAGTLVPLSAQTPTPKPATGAAASKPRPRWMEPVDDRYVKVLAGKALEEGKGFPGVIVLGRSSTADSDLIGWGREDPMVHPFWLYYEKGPWTLTICVNMDGDAHAGMNHAIIVAGEGAPPTKKGLKIGDPLTRVRELYGPPGTFDSALVGLEELGRTHTRTTFGKDGKTEDYTVSDPPEFANALFFPAARLLVVMENDSVKRLAVVAAEEPLPIFLLPAERVPPNRAVVIDRKVKVPVATPFDPKNPTADGPKFLVPPIPEMTKFETANFSAMVPKGWRHEREDTWVAPEGGDSVTIGLSEGTPDQTPEVILDFLGKTLKLTNLVPPFRRHLPADFCKTADAEDGACCLFRAKGKGEESDTLMYQMVLAKQEGRVHVLVTRRAHPTQMKMPGGGTRTSAFMGSPDGDALARAVMRSLRIKA